MFREDHSSLPLTHSHTAMRVRVLRLAELFPSERTWFTDCHPQDDIHCTSEYLPTTTQTTSVGSVNIYYTRGQSSMNLLHTSHYMHCCYGCVCCLPVEGLVMILSSTK